MKYATVESNNKSIPVFPLSNDISIYCVSSSKSSISIYPLYTSWSLGAVHIPFINTKYFLSSVMFLSSILPTFLSPTVVVFV